MSKHLTHLDLSFNTSNTVLDLTLTMKFWFCYDVPALILSVWSNVSNNVRLLIFYIYTSCIQFNDEHITLWVELYQDLPCLEVFNAEYTGQFSVANARVLLERHQLQKLAITPVWEPSTLRIHSIREYRHIIFGWCINVHCGRVNFPSDKCSD